MESLERAGAPGAPLAWSDFSPATFARAKAEHKFIVMDGAAEWCHWCHVMEAVTYHDDAVRKILDAHFIPVKVDVDSRPDIEERYSEYGWPATVIFSPNADELGKYRGYIAPEDFVEILNDVVASGGDKSASKQAEPEDPILSDAPITLAQIQATQDATAKALEAFWDPAQGGWGKQPKVPISGDVAWAILRAKQGDLTLREHMLTMLKQEQKIMDPIWGGIYQYSVAPDWDHPHFEKLVVFNAGAIDNYAAAYMLTKDPQYLSVARSIEKYEEAFAISPEGGFHGSQDADLNAHAVGKTFLDGHKYYALDDAHRRALGIPRVDEHEYAKDTGLAITGYATLYEATHDANVLAVAARAANHIVETHGTTKGGVSHDAIADKTSEPHVLHLADNAALGLGLMRLYEVTNDGQWLSMAQKIADYMLSDFFDPERGGFFANNVDPDAVGVFSTRRKAFDDNVAAVRFFEKLARAKKDPKVENAIDRSLRFLSNPAHIHDNGKFLGDFLLALEAAKH
jgi:uncharacterized protein YyaL (SSP411 family)